MEVQDANFGTSVVDVIKGYGYPIEVYEDVKTEDGYLLTLYRIPHGINNKSNDKRPVVLLIHGMLCSSADYIIAGPNRSLGFILSDHGFDVWLSNSRGVAVSRKHTKYDSEKDADYWKFSFHEMGVYDLPAIFDEIEKVTNLRTISFVVQSQGTFVPLSLLCEKPEYNKRVNIIVGMSSAVSTPNMRSIPYLALNAGRYFVEALLEHFGQLQFLPKSVNKWMDAARRRAQKSTWMQEIIIQCLYLLHGRTPQQLIKEDIPVMMRYYPDTTSFFVLKHLGQNMRTGEFSKFDHGPKRNLEKYGTPTPPVYDLGKVTAAAALFCSSGDLVVQPEDARKLRDGLGNCIALHEIEDPIFNHSDFLFGRHVVGVVYPILLKYLKEFSKAI